MEQPEVPEVVDEVADWGVEEVEEVEAVEEVVWDVDEESEESEVDAVFPDVAGTGGTGSDVAADDAADDGSAVAADDAADDAAPLRQTAKAAVRPTAQAAASERQTCDFAIVGEERRRVGPRGLPHVGVALRGAQKEREYRNTDKL